MDVVRLTDRYRSARPQVLGLAVVLLSYRNHQPGSKLFGLCWPSQPTLAARVRESVNTVKRYLRVLLDAGVIRAAGTHPQIRGRPSMPSSIRASPRGIKI